MQKHRLTREEMRVWRENQPGERDKLLKNIADKYDVHKIFVMTPSNKFLKSLRKPEFASADNAAIGTTAGAVVPSPEACACKAYAGTKKGEHHPVCQFAAAWKQKRGTLTKVVALPTQGVTHMMAMKPRASDINRVMHQKVAQGPYAPAPKAKPAVVKPAVPSPTECVCKNFAKPKEHDETQHHFMCEFHDLWKKHVTEHAQASVATTTNEPQQEAASSEEQLVIFDIETKTVMRDATPEEISEARAEEERTGSPLIRIDDKIYGVISPP